MITYMYPELFVKL